MINEIKVALEIRQSDLNAFERLYFEYQPRLYAFSKKFIPNNELAKDIVQEVFIDFWERRQDIEIKTSIKSYLFQMIHNRCLNYIRDQKIRDKYSNYVETKLKEAELLFFNQTQESYKSIFFEDIKKILDQSIQDLPESCKEIFILSRGDGLSNKEISEQLNISVRTVENQIYRALKVLKESLKDYLVIFPFLLSLLYK
jgi:RNA polymerase sigma-70 factor, ECF subfamily